ncbi:MAG: type III-B CRISPR module RAMP protein Cmr1 [Gemmatales bacterium]|nr:MAG: type III-B CRISPR module RAMP protein Cmr1 [Gemmatales bacterium]
MPRLDDLRQLKVPAAPTAELPGVEKRTYRIKLITPMFGGGVEAGQPDPSFSIRPTAIRGQLHYWWRLRNNHLSVSQLRGRESEVFGDTEASSPLTVRVSKCHRVKLVDPVPTYGDRFSPAAYALFAAIENGNKIIKEGAEFTLEVEWLKQAQLNARRKKQNEQRAKSKQSQLPETIDDIGPDIEGAIHLWMTLGGLGARTRRGCGAIASTNDDVYLDSSVVSALRNVGVRIFLGDKCRSPLDAWKQSVGDYREFRQTPRGAIHPKTIHTKKGARTINVPGRSYWPEADSIRHITGCSLRPTTPSGSSGVPADANPHDHSTPIVPSSVIPSFPRAALGLPINFHFSDAPGKKSSANPNQDPKDVQLEPVLANGDPGERMASPILTRPIRWEGAWHAAIILLPVTFPGGLRLRGGGVIPPSGDLNQRFPQSAFVGPHVRAVRPMRGKEDAIDGLVAFITSSKRYTEQK